ncbi:terminase-like family protein [Vibrio phage 1.262.O._10N.286.51.A9]|nr:terminase-like family protein [Vibrio phage 1.262.O._10N.286.51.A9]
MDELERLQALVDAEQEYKKFNKLLDFKPYPWQKKFVDVSIDCTQKLAMCANRIGKTFTGAAELSYHLTGEYPDWWEGKRFDKPINAWACGVSNVTTRDILQLELLGQPDDPTAIGSGALPKHAIIDTVRLPGVPNALQSATVRHKSGGVSRLGFKSYEMGEHKFMGSALDFIWLDEEPPHNIFTQCITRTATTNGIVSMTFTPENGMTETCRAFMYELKDGQALVQATWDDAPHINERTKEQLLSVYSPHEREMRSRGIPVFGSGQVFPFPEETIVCDPFPIPEHYARIAGLDFGFDHPTAVIWVAWDRESDTVFLYDEHYMSKQTAIVHSAAINSRPRGIPVVWPHDGYQHDKGSGIQLAQQYRNSGVNMTAEHFKNPVALGEKSGKGSNSIEVGIMEMYQMMEQGRFKVFSTCRNWLQEFREYHRQDGKIVPLKDDAMSASRYAVMSRGKYAVTIVGGDDYSDYNVDEDYSGIV